MTELITVAFWPQNILLTALLLSIVLYWVTVILGVLDVDLFNVEPPEPDFDWDAETDLDTDLGSGVVWGVLEWFYIGEIPIMVLVSLLILSLWTGSMVGSYFFNPQQSWGRALALLGPNLIVSLLAVKVVGWGLRPFYRLFTRDANAPGRIVGRLCRVTSRQVTDSTLGQAEVATRGAPLVLTVRTRDGEVLKQNEEAVVVGRDEATGVYWVVSAQLERSSC